MNSRMPSRGRPRKSVNWARPLAVTSTQKKGAIKRISTRLSGEAFASATNPCSGCIKPADKDHIDKICVRSSNSDSKEELIRIVSYPRTRRGARKNVAVAAGPMEPSMEPNFCSNERSNSKTEKRAACNVLRRGEDKLDGELIGVEAGKQWVSVPLDDMEGEGGDWKTRDSMNLEVNCQSLRPPDNAARTAEGGRSIGVCSFNAAWHENPELSKKNSEAETHDAAYKEFSRLLGGQKREVNYMEHRIHEMRENQLKKLRKEKDNIEADAALEQQRLRHEIAQLSLKNSRILHEKLAIERERDLMKNDFLRKLEKSRESFRLEVREENTEIVAALTKELGKEQEKTCCQICFAHPRDSIILPCMHFHYCNECLREHQRRLKECPTCRTKINGVLRCNVCTS